MALETVLTTNWPPIVTTDSYNAVNLHNQASQTDDYIAKLRELLTALREQTGKDKPMPIHSVGRLFRRRPGGFSALKKFVSTCEGLTDKTLQPLFFGIDVFSYAFLKGAKNFDAIMRETKATTIKSPFRNIYPQWQKEIAELELFEREGVIPKSPDIIESYLKLRQVVAPNSAREERRTLATLLVSGPSTAEEIAADLGMSYGLSGRMLPTFEQVGVVVGQEEVDAYRYALKTETLPQVIFCLRETMGIDLLEVV
jgi:hypothetical protein